MFDLAAGGAAMILEKNATKNLMSGSHLVADGTLARGCMLPIGGTAEPVNRENVQLNRCVLSARMLLHVLLTLGL
jgi:3-oxoacyl-[acyl-carrier-protein] synthase-3